MMRIGNLGDSALDPTGSDFSSTRCIFWQPVNVAAKSIFEVSPMQALTKDDLKTEADLSEDADLIVNKTAHFVGDWIEEHVVEQPTLVPAGVDVAQELASQCIADAQDEGIAAEDIQAEVGDIREYIAEAIDDEGGSLGSANIKKARAS